VHASFIWKLSHLWKQIKWHFQIPEASVIVNMILALWLNSTHLAIICNLDQTTKHWAKLPNFMQVWCMCYHLVIITHIMGLHSKAISTQLLISWSISAGWQFSNVLCFTCSDLNYLFMMGEYNINNCKTSIAPISLKSSISAWAWTQEQTKIIIWLPR